MKNYKIEEVCEILGVEDQLIFQFVSKEWLSIASPKTNEFDDEDLTRIRLILELMNKLDVNEEAVPIILHLVDQIHQMRFEIDTRNSL